MKYLNGILIGIIGFLLLMSFIAIITIHWNFFDNEFLFSPKGLEIYLSSYGNYKSLFTGTIATTAAYFGLLRVKVSEEANREKIKQDYFTEWKTIVQVRAVEVGGNDKLMLREIIKIRHGLYNDLYDKKFNINSKTTLTTLFNKHIKSSVYFFETMNDKCIGMGECYPDNNHSYSFDAFRFIFFGMIENFYDEIEKDLKELYISNMNPDRYIDVNTYKSALQNYSR